MEFKELITARKSIRKYEAGIGHEALAEILKEARRAPSWKNQQTARCYAVETPETLEEFRAAAKNREFDLCYCETRMTADWNMSPLVASWGPLNYSGWSDARMAGLLEQYVSASDRVEAMRQVCEHLKEQAPILPICFACNTVLMQSNVVENLTPTAIMRSLFASATEDAKWPCIPCIPRNLGVVEGSSERPIMEHPIYASILSASFKISLPAPALTAPPPK